MARLLRKLLISTVLFIGVFISTSYALTVWLKTLEIKFSVSKTIDLEWITVDPAEIEVENLTIVPIDVSPCGNYYYCSLENVEVAVPKFLGIFKIRINPYNHSIKPLFYFDVDRGANVSFVYGILKAGENCTTYIDGGSIDLCEVYSASTAYPTNVTLEETDSLKEYYIFLYIPESADSGTLNFTVRVAIE